MSTWLQTPHLRIRYKNRTIALSEVESWELKYYHSKPRHEGIVFYLKSERYRSWDNLKVGEAEYLQEEMDKVIEILDAGRIIFKPTVIRPYEEVLAYRKEQEEKAIALELEKNPPQVEVSKLEPIIEKVPVKRKSIWNIFGN